MVISEGHFSGKGCGTLKILALAMFQPGGRRRRRGSQLTIPPSDLEL